MCWVTKLVYVASLSLKLAYLRCDLSLIDGDNGGADADRPPRDYTTNAQESDTIGSSLQNGTDDPNKSRDLNGSPTRQAIGQKGRREGADQRARRHGSRDSTLAGSGWLVEIVLVRLSTQDTGHGRDIETKEPAADCSKAADGVDVVKSLSVLAGAQLIWGSEIEIIPSFCQVVSTRLGRENYRVR